MMLLVGILMLYVTGASILVRFSTRFNWKETIALSFLLGIATQTFFMFIADVIGFGFTQLVLFFASFALVIFNYDLLYSYYQEHKQAIKMPSITLGLLNYPAILLLLLILVLFYIITEKNLYWPAAEHDSIASFDKLGMIMALEGKIKISLFQYNLQGSGGIYPPLFHGGIAYMYLFGAESPKIITTLFYGSLLLSFYAFCKKYVSAINALFFTLLLEMVPEMYSHAALLLGNIPATANVAVAGLSLFYWLDKRENAYLWLSATFIALSLWTRNDTIGFAIAAVVVVFVALAKEKDWKRIAIYTAVSFSTLVIWTLYLKFKIDIPQTSRFIDHFGFDEHKMGVMLLYVSCMISWLQYGTMSPGYLLYGLAFILPIVVILLNVRNIRKDHPGKLLFILISFVVYFLIFYLIDEKKQGSTITDLMESSFKRGVFCFIPLLLFYASTSSVVVAFSNWIENFRYGR
jgi:hypothetical protein